MLSSFTCFKGTYMGRVVAVKQRKTDKMTLDEFLTEAVQLHQLRHENILQLVGVCTRSSPVLIITEFMINGCLQKYLRNDETRKSLGYRHILNLACQVCSAFLYFKCSRNRARPSDTFITRQALFRLSHPTTDGTFST